MRVFLCLPYKRRVDMGATSSRIQINKGICKVRDACGCQTWERGRPLPIPYKIELDKEIAHETAERMRRAIAINMVIAWRIMLMTLMGREVSELPPDVLFSDIELCILSVNRL